MRALLIAEKPSLMREIQKVYNQHKQEIGISVDFKAQAGHLLGLKMPDEINPAYKKWNIENLPLQVPFRYKIMKGKNDLVREIKAAIQSGNYDFIIHAGDPDQEGEILIRETLDYANNSLPVKRFWSNDLTEGAILQALMHLRDDAEYDNLASAGYVRQHKDYDYGMNLTEAMTLKSGTLVRMGRVKAAILGCIVNREREIEEFVPSSTYQRAFTYQGHQFVDTSDTFDTVEQLQQTLTHVPTKAEVISCKTERKLSKAPKLYKLSTLQTDAFNKYHMPAATVLATAQSLYEKQLTTYPRSACEYISSAVDVMGIYRQIQGGIPEIAGHHLSPRSEESIKADKAYCNDKAIASEGHTGIMPTGKRPSNLTDTEAKLYQLICRRFAAICLPPKETEVTVVTAKDENGYRYDHKGVKDIQPSYEYVLNPNYQSKQYDFKPNTHDILSPITFEPKEIEKKCPSRFNEGSLIKFLSNPKDYKDEDGHSVKYTIGTEATRAGIINECVSNNYLTKESGTYLPTDFAKTVVKEYGDLAVFQIETSAQWEAIMEDIRQGEVSADEVERAMTDNLYEMVADIKERQVTKLAYHTNKANSKAVYASQDAICKCPCCKDGDIRENSKAFGCSNWNADPKCDFTLWKSCFGTTLTKTDAKKLIEGQTITKTCHSKAGSSYKAELAYDFNNRKVVRASELSRSKGNEVER